MAAKTKTRYDIEQLLNDADMKEVAQEIGIKINYEKKTRKNTGILCPNPDHTDQHFGNCFIKPDNTYICYSCGDSGNVIHMVMQFTGVSFPKALEIVAEICGGKDHYLYTSDMTESDFQHALNQRECDLIGLYNSSVFGIVNIGTEEIQQPGMRARLIDWTKEDEPIYAIEKCLVPNPLLILMREDMKTYKELVMQKVKAVLDAQKELINSMECLQGGEIFIPGHCAEIEEIENLLIKHFPKEEYTQEVLQSNYTHNGKKALIKSVLGVKSVSSPF